MKALTFSVTCPWCGSPVDHVTSGRVIAGRETSAIVRCTTCPEHLAEWHIALRMAPVRDVSEYSARRSLVALCGTPSGYTAHRRAGEQPCAPCTQAHAAYERARLAKKRREKVGVFV